MYEFKLPDVGEGIHEAEVLKWLVKVGDKVKLNQPILEIQTDKAIVEIPSPVAGTVTEIRAENGIMVHVGDVLITFTVLEESSMPAQKPNNGQTKDNQSVMKQHVGIAGPNKRILAAPAVRKMALEAGVNLTNVPGSGPAGRVLTSDVKQYIEQQKRPAQQPVQKQSQPAALPTVAPTPQPSVAPLAPSAVPVRQVIGQEIVEEESLQGLRRRIAQRMELAWKIPHVTTFDEIEVSKLVTLRQKLKVEAERRGVRLTYLPFIIKATVQALKEFPAFNASLDMERQKILYHRYYHMGVATAVPDGLLVPVIRHADHKNLIQLAVELKRLSELAQNRRLGVEELSGSTFTITNFGSYGSRMGTPIINAPEVAILGTGRIEDRAVVVNGEVVIRPILPLALSFDHRLIDGAISGQFLSRLRALLNDPNLLFLEMA